MRLVMRARLHSEQVPRMTKVWPVAWKPCWWQTSLTAASMAGLWNTATAGNSTTLSPRAAGLHTTGPAYQESLLTTYYKPFVQPVEGGFPFRGGVVGPRGDLPADPLDQVEADALPERRGGGRRP